jgi:hypothetical protein
VEATGIGGGRAGETGFARVASLDARVSTGTVAGITVAMAPAATRKPPKIHGNKSVSACFGMPVLFYVSAAMATSIITVSVRCRRFRGAPGTGRRAAAELMHRSGPV